jgi:glc operon protein GlcG
VVLAVVDDGGHLCTCSASLCSSAASSWPLPRHARAALLFRRPTRVWEETVASGRYGYLAMPWNAAIEGGVPLVYENEIMGASGVSGSSPRKTPLVQLRRAEFPPPSRLILERG